MSDVDLRFPVGKYEAREKLTDENRKQILAQLAETPKRLRAAVAGLSREQLNTPYRDGGWTVQQVVHHLADAHMNAYTRFKLALTEDEPTVKPFDEARWAELSDSKTTPVETSLALIDALDERFMGLVRGMIPSDFSRKFRHPERGVMTLDSYLGLHGWHDRHHVAHITNLRQRKSWT